MKKYYFKYRYFASIAAIVAMGLLIPKIGGFMKDYRILQIGVFISFFITGAELETDKLLNPRKNAKPLIAAIISTLILFPAVTMLITKLIIPVSNELFIGICILSVVPVTTITAIVLTRTATGNTALSLLINVTTNILALATVPISLKILLSGNSINLPTTQIMTKILVMVIIPITIGQIARPKIAPTISKHKGPVSMFSKMIILLIILNAVSNSSERIMQIGWPILSIFLLVGLLHGIIVAMNMLIAKTIKLDQPSSAAFIITASQKTLVLSFIVWNGFFNHLAFAILPSICYHLTQSVADTYLARSLAKRKGD